MARPKKTEPEKNQKTIEATLFATVDKLRGAMDTSEYKHVVLGLIFLKFISDAFIAHHATLAADPTSDEEDPEEYLAENIFWVPEPALAN